MYTLLIAYLYNMCIQYRVGCSKRQKTGTCMSACKACMLLFILIYIYTGFSFGGLLASTVTALVWDLPYISADLLKDNLTCITFGKPCVSVRVIQTVAQRRPEISTTIHSIYSEIDVVPSLMSFLDESWSAKDLSKPDGGTGEIQLVMTHSLDAVS